MKKKLRIKLIGSSFKDEYTLEGDVTDNYISYIDNSLCLMKIDLIKKIILRENSEYIIEYDLEKELGNILLKEENKKINLNIKTKQFLNDGKKIIIEYIVNDVEEVLLEIGEEDEYN